MKDKEDIHDKERKMAQDGYKNRGRKNEWLDCYCEGRYD